MKPKLYFTGAIILTLAVFSGCSESDENDSNETDTTSSDMSAGDSDSDSATAESIDSGVDSQTTDTHSDTLASDDSDINSDTDTGEDTSSVIVDTETETETETDSDIQDCVTTYTTPMSCYGECLDGFQYVVYYDKAEVAEPETWSNYPSTEVLAAGIAWYYDSVCGSCERWYKVKNENAEWVETTITAFCRTIVDAQRACDTCIAVATGGGG